MLVGWVEGEAVKLDDLVSGELCIEKGGGLTCVDWMWLAAD